MFGQPRNRHAIAATILTGEGLCLNSAVAAQRRADLCDRSTAVIDASHLPLHARADSSSRTGGQQLFHSADSRRAAPKRHRSGTSLLCENTETGASTCSTAASREPGLSSVFTRGLIDSFWPTPSSRFPRSLFFFFFFFAAACNLILH